MSDPTARSLRPRSNQDYERVEAIRAKGGTCLPCRQAKTRCDAFDHCQRCIHKNVLSEKEFIASINTSSNQPGLEDISLCQLYCPAVLDNRSLAETDSGITNTTIDGRADNNHAYDQVTRWFKKVTSMTDPKPFDSFTVQREVTLKITSGPNRNKTTDSSFSLDYFDISCHLEQQSPYWLTEDNLVAAFLGHSSAPKAPAPQDGPPRSQDVKHLSWLVTHIFNFLQDFEEADVYAAIRHIPAARASVSLIMASFYHLLLQKGDALCSFVLASERQKFSYCIRGTSKSKSIVEDSLGALAEYHSVLTRLAGPRWGSSSEVAALFQSLGDRAEAILLHRGTERLFLRVYNQLKVKPKRTINNTSQSEIKELINRYCARPSDTRVLSIALRVNPVQSDMAPVPTEAFRDTDPYHHHRCIKVRDLLKESESSATDPKQIFVDGFVNNFDFLGDWLPGEAESSSNGASLFFGPMPFDSSASVDTQSLLTSLDREHASERPSQDDTDLESIKSESTVQDVLGLDWIFDSDATQVGGDCSEPKASPDLEWQHVPRGKGCKRRKGSGDSSNSDRSSARGRRKHVRSGSPPASHTQNYFGVLTGEPTRLL